MTILFIPRESHLDCRTNISLVGCKIAFKGLIEEVGTSREKNKLLLINQTKFQRVTGYKPSMTLKLVLASEREYIVRYLISLKTKQWNKLNKSKFKSKIFCYLHNWQSKINLGIGSVFTISSWSSLKAHGFKWVDSLKNGDGGGRAFLSKCEVWSKIVRQGLFWERGLPWKTLKVLMLKGVIWAIILIVITLISKHKSYLCDFFICLDCDYFKCLCIQYFNLRKELL